VDGMNITITSTQQITALTVNGNTGQSIVGGATSLKAGGAQTFVYRLANTTWYNQGNNATIPASGYAGPNAQVFASSSTFTVPDGITSLRITVYGGGGGGQSSNQRSGGAGGFASGVYTVTSGTTYTVTVGAGGAGAASGTASSGQTSSFSSLISATGGTGGSAAGNGSNGVGSNGTFNNGNIISSNGEFIGTTSRTGSAAANLAAVAWSPTLKGPTDSSAQLSPGARGNWWFNGCNAYYSGGVGGAVLVQW
jgi:hypothetical protein